jgi:hypothetical protein
MCVAQAMCGGSGQMCCATMPNCNMGLTCQNGTCNAMVGGNTGDPCMKATDCAGNKPVCITKDTMGTTWPGGYCTSTCNPNMNDPNTGLNPQCPGGSGLCLGQGTQGACELACTDMMGQMPCRMGYSCFQGCEPTSLSECDPTKSIAMNSGCAQDAGTGKPRVCVRIGADNVGQCTDGCDPFAQNCTGMMMACYASDDTGEGVCSQEFGNVGMQGDGVVCMYLNACDAGFACYAPPMANQAVCRPYCGGPKSIQCSALMPKPMKLNCVDLSTTVKVATIGVCGG